MPAHRKELPQACPICGQNYGTIQLVAFNAGYPSSSKIICRIGHYSPRRYKNNAVNVTVTTGPNFTDYTHVTKYLKTRGRYWHQFHLHEKLVNRSRWLSDFDVEEYVFPRQKSYTFHLPPELWKIIKDEGWHVKSRELLEKEFRSLFGFSRNEKINPYDFWDWARKQMYDHDFEVLKRDSENRRWTDPASYSGKKVGHKRATGATDRGRAARRRGLAKKKRSERYIPQHAKKPTRDSGNLRTNDEGRSITRPSRPSRVSLERPRRKTSTKSSRRP